MNRTVATEEQVTCAALFELTGAGQNSISKELYQYLISKQFPWLALGKALTEFVKSQAESVPQGKRHAGNISPQAHLVNPDQIVVCEGAEIEAFAYIEGPTWIGPGAKVRHGAYVRGSVYADQGAVIGHTTEAKGCLLLPNAKASHFAYIGDSILGIETNLGAGTKLANLRFDHQTIKLHLSGKRIDSMLKKFGAIFGNRAQSGCNSVTNPGTILLPGASILPCSNARQIVA